MGKDGQIFYQSDGSVRLKDGTKIRRRITFRGRMYTLVSALGDKRRAKTNARGWRRQFGGAIIRQLEVGNYGIYATL